MKKRNRVLGALSVVVFGVLIVTFLIAFFIYFVGDKPQMGMSFIDAVKRMQILFDFNQTELFIITQYVTLGIFGVGALWGIIWLLIGACKKHIVEIAFFIGIVAAFFFFGMVCMYHGDALLKAIVEPKGGVIDGALVGRLAILPAICVVILAGLIVTFAYDMKRIFAKDDPILFQEPKEYSQETLFKEVFEEVEEELKPVNPTEEQMVADVMAKVDNMIAAEMLASLPLKNEDIPNILKEKDEEEVIEHLPFLDKPLPEEVKEPEPVKEEYVYPHLRMFDKPVQEEKSDEYVYPDLPMFKESTGNVKKDSVKNADIPDFLKTENELAKETMAELTNKSTAASSKAYHISKTDNGYQVKLAGDKSIKGMFKSELEAVEFIRKESPDSSIRVHDKDGKIHSL